MKQLSSQTSVMTRDEWMGWVQDRRTTIFFECSTAWIYRCWLLTTTLCYCMTSLLLNVLSCDILASTCWSLKEPQFIRKPVAWCWMWVPDTCKAASGCLDQETLASPGVYRPHNQLLNSINQLFRLVLPTNSLTPKFEHSARSTRHSF